MSEKERITPEENEKDKELFGYDKIVETEGADVGRIKDIEVARKMAEAENKERDKNVSIKKVSNRIRGKKENLEEKKIQKGKEAAEKVAQEEIRKKAEKSYVENDYDRVAAERAASEHVDAYRKVNEKVRTEKEKELTELREKIKTLPGTYKAEDELKLEGRGLGYIKSVELSREMAEEEKKIRKDSMGGKIKKLFNTLTFRGSKNTNLDKSREQSAGLASDKIAEEHIRQKATEEYQKMGYRTDVAEQAARDEVSKYRNRGTKIEAERQRQKEEILEQTGLKKSEAQTTPTEPEPQANIASEQTNPPVEDDEDIPAEVFEGGTAQSENQEQSLANPEDKKSKKKDFKPIGDKKTKLGSRYYENPKTGEIITDKEYKLLEN